MYFCNCVTPLVFFWKKARTNTTILYVVSIFVLIGMWLERFNIIVPGLGHDFYPYTWGTYYPTITDSTIIVGLVRVVLHPVPGLHPRDAVALASSRSRRRCRIP